MYIDKFVHGTPKPQPRPRATIRGNHAGVYNPKTADEWKNQVIAGLWEHRLKEIEGPISLYLSFVLPRPKVMNGNKYPDGVIPHIKKPDIDNLVKSTMDAMSDMGIWGDDRQVCQLITRKNYQSKGGAIGVIIIMDGIAI